MKTYINKFISILLLSWMVFFLSFYLLRAVLIENRDMMVVLSFDHINEDIDLLVSFNFSPNQVESETFEVKLVNGQLRFPFPKKIDIRRIFIFSNEAIELKLKTFELENAYKAISYQADELFGKVEFILPKRLDSSIVKLKDNKLVIPFSNLNSVLEFKSSIVSNLNSSLINRLSNIAFIISLVAFIVLLIVFFSMTNLVYVPNSQFNFCLFFLVLLFTPFFSIKDHRTSENRKLAPFPDLNVNVWKIPARYTRYYNDHFPYRSSLAQINNYIKVKFFKTSPNPENVSFNDNGWLFSSSKKIIGTYQGLIQYSEIDLKTIKEKLEEKVSLLNKNGIDFYLIVPPLKHTVYSEELPRGMEIMGKSKRAQVMEYLKENSSINIIDPLPLLNSLKEEVRVYYKTDTHWNQMGAFRVYQMIINSIKVDHPEIGDPLTLNDYYVKKTHDCGGDLIPLLNLQGIFCREPYFFSNKNQKKSGNIKFGEKLGYEANYFYYDSEELKDKPRVLVYKDSYGEYLYPHLSEHFSYSGFAWDRTLNLERIEKANPDIIILELMERFIDHLLTENEYDDRQI